MHAVDDRAWRYCRRTFLLYDDERATYSQTMIYRLARVQVALSDTRRAIERDRALGSLLKRLGRWLLP